MSYENDVIQIKLLSEAENSNLNKRIPIVKNNWEYVVIPSENGGYGYTILIYKNGVEIYKQGGFGSTGMAQVHARDIFLSDEFGIDRGEENQ